MPLLREQMDEPTFQAMRAAIGNAFAPADATAQAITSAAAATAAESATAAPVATSASEACADAAPSPHTHSPAAFRTATAPACRSPPWYLQPNCTPVLPDAFGVESAAGTFPQGLNDRLAILIYRMKWLCASRILLPSLPPYADIDTAARAGDGPCTADSRNIDQHLGQPAPHTGRFSSGLFRTAQNYLQVAPVHLAAHAAALRRLLRAWCLLRPDMAYVRPMGRIASVMLCVAGHDEPTAFAAFAALVHRRPAQCASNDSVSSPAVQDEVSRLTRLVEGRSPGLLGPSRGAGYRALPLVASKWFIDLFIKALPLASLLVAWDLLLEPVHPIPRCSFLRATIRLDKLAAAPPVARWIRTPLASMAARSL